MNGLIIRGCPRRIIAARQLLRPAWHRALRGAGLVPDRFTFHALRHFCASSLLAEGAPLTAVAGHLGDTVETVSSVYVHWLRDDHDVPAAVLDRVLAPAAEYQLEYFGGSIGLSTPRFPRLGA
jgi:integrase